MNVNIQHSDDNATWTDSGIAFEVDDSSGAATHVEYVNLDGLKKHVRAACEPEDGADAVTVSIIIAGVKEQG